MKVVKNILLRIPYVVLLGLPYVFMIFFNMWLKSETEGDTLEQFTVIITAFSLIAALIVQARMIISSTVMSFRESSIWNLVTKIIYLPAHIYMFSLGYVDSPVYSGFFALIWLVLLCVSFDLMTCSAAANIAACAKGHDEGKLKLSTTIIMMILSYVYVADVICAIVQVTKSKARKV